MKTDKELVLIERFERVCSAANALLDRLEATQGQAFYDMTKPEIEALDAALCHCVETPWGVWRYDRRGNQEEIKP